MPGPDTAAPGGRYTRLNPAPSARTPESTSGKHDKELPVTGDDSAVALSLGGGLLAAGGLLIGASRIRRKAGVQV
ncbi:LPXTG cell wall anchor domain-containing protein [Micromonospora sp. NPDC052213]|uniref:LPXTG cell wall anchor domain-containing protein n=1 Tax=Micromonospora sp. NPDC052213 TaxID=3155812 RepID=UPI00343951D3